MLSKLNSRKKKPVIFALVCLSLLSLWAAYAYGTAARLSAAVTLVNKGRVIESFLARPGKSFVETYFRFEDGLRDDVVFGVDQEFIEGLERPVYVKGGDWMGLVGLQRTGTVWITCGTEATHKGIPSTDRNWKILSLGQALKPGTWYHMKCTVDFATRHFSKLEVDGPGLAKTLDLSGYTVDYPNYMPFDKSAMSYYVFSMRSRTMMRERGKPMVCFDDMKGGVVGPSGETVVFASDFERQTTVPEQPVTLPVIKLQNYKEGILYLERNESRFRIETLKEAHSGSHVGVADADLD